MRIDTEYSYKCGINGLDIEDVLMKENETIIRHALKATSAVRTRHLGEHGEYLDKALGIDLKFSNETDKGLYAAVRVRTTNYSAFSINHKNVGSEINKWLRCWKDYQNTERIHFNVSVVPLRNGYKAVYVINVAIFSMLLEKIQEQGKLDDYEALTRSGKKLYFYEFTDEDIMELCGGFHQLGIEKYVYDKDDNYVGMYIENKFNKVNSK